MVQVWGVGEGPDFTCPTEGCGARYKVTIHRFPMREHDKAHCQKCGEVMKEWNSTESPSFTLIEN